MMQGHMQTSLASCTPRGLLLMRCSAGPVSLVVNLWNGRSENELPGARRASGPPA